MIGLDTNILVYAHRRDSEWFQPTYAAVKQLAEGKELKALLGAGKVRGGAIQDARIAAICREHGVRELWSADRDFTRLGGLTVKNPLIN